MYISEKDAGILKITKIIATVLVTSSVLYLFVAYYLSTQNDYPHAEYLEMVSFMLLPVAAFLPFILLSIEKLQIKALRNSTNKRPNPGGLFFSLFIIKFTGAEAAFIFGLIVFFLGGGITRMLYFYPIGFIWMYILWPREEAFNKFLKQLEGE